MAQVTNVSGQPIAVHVHMKHAILGFVEATLSGVVRRVHGHVVPTIDQGDGGIHDQALGTTNAQIGVEESDFHGARVVG